MTLSTDSFSVIAELDLDPIKVKLMHEESGEGWSLEQAEAVEFEYRRFLYLMKKYPRELAAPRSDVDIFWHYHILDTIKYANDCQAVFGYFLHHFPYVGLRGEDDLAAHQRVGERMRELYEETFDRPYTQAAVAAKRKTPKSRSSTALARGPGAPSVSASGHASAYSLATAGTAYSLATAGTAYSLATVDTAYSLATATTAYSLATASTGNPMSATGAEFSIPAVGDPRSQTADTRTIWDQHSPGFLNARPSLAMLAAAAR